MLRIVRSLRLQSEFEDSGLRKTKPNRDDCMKATFPVCLFVFKLRDWLVHLKKLMEGFKNISNASIQTTLSEVSLEVSIQSLSKERKRLHRISSLFHIMKTNSMLYRA